MSYISVKPCPTKYQYVRIYKTSLDGRYIGYNDLHFPSLADAHVYCNTMSNKTNITHIPSPYINSIPHMTNLLLYFNDEKKDFKELSSGEMYDISKEMDVSTSFEPEQP